ncbi:MAG: DUF3667 domain-containing protein [Pacificimonas sp.]
MDLQEIGGAIFGGALASRFTGEGGKSTARHAAHAGTHHTDCQNCGAPTPGNYCPECGQHAHVTRSVGHVLHELVHGVLHLDGKFWRTLPMLVFRPGRLTRDYIEGKRARYVAPFGIFLFTIFTVYFTFAFINPGDAFTGNEVEIGSTTDADPAREGQQLTLEDARAQRDELSRQIAELEAEMEAIDNPAAIGGMVSGLVAMEKVKSAFDDEIAAAEAREAETGEAQTIDIELDADGMVRSIGAEVGDTISTGDFTFIGVEGWEWINEPVTAMFKNPDYALYRIKQSAYKFSFLLLPLSLPFIWLLFFWRRDIHIYDHTVFVLYSLSFFLLAGTALWAAVGLGWIGWLTAGLVGAAAHQAHMFFQLKGTYGLGIFGALVRTSLLTISGFIVLILYGLIITGLGAFI